MPIVTDAAQCRRTGCSARAVNEKAGSDPG